MMVVVAWAMTTTSRQTGWKYLLCTTSLMCVTTLLSKEVRASMSWESSGIGGNGDDEGEATKGTTTMGKGEVSKVANGNGDAKGKTWWDASKDAVGNGNNKVEVSKGTVGNGRRQVKLLWAMATTRGTGAKVLWATAMARVGILIVVEVDDQGHPWLLVYGCL